LHLTAAARVQATLSATASGSTYAPILNIINNCADTTGVTCGGDGQSPFASVDVVSLAAGDYLFVLDGYSGSFGEFSLVVTLAAPLSAPANDLCSAAAPLSSLSGVGSSATVTGTTVAASNEIVSPNCGGRSSDVYYTVVVPQASRLTATLTNDTGSTLAPILALDSSCPETDGGSSEVACVIGVTPGTAVLDIPSVAAGTYVLRVDGSNTSAGAFSLSVVLGTPVAGPANDSCATAQTIAIATIADGGYYGSTAFSTFGGNDTTTADPAGNCDPATNNYTSGSDVVFKVTLPAGLTDLTATYLDSSGAPDQGTAVVIVRQGPTCTDAAGPELSCGPSSAAAAVTAAGDYFVWVDSIVGLPAAAGTLEVTAH
jgi:hypothetical protein